MFSWLGISAINPLLLWGAVAASAPIIIHLLSKRKFKIVDWAAMDFLFEANRRNRRRVRLENLILLLLRCLVMLLLAFLVARPFFTPGGPSNRANANATFERIILLDDSPSMRATGAGQEWAFDDAKKGLIQFVCELSEFHPGDRVTLLLTSDPETPRLNGKILQGDGAGSAGADDVSEVVRVIKNLQPSDRAAQLDRALLAVEKMLETEEKELNRVVYLVTDLRQHDWIAPKSTAKDRGPAQIARRVSARAEGFIVVDVGGVALGNLILADIRVLDEAQQQSQLVAGVPTRFQATVRNLGETPVSDVDVQFTAGDTGTQRKRISKEIPPGGEGTIAFEVKLGDRNDDEQSPRMINVPVRFEIDQPDALPQDNRRLYAARVSSGVRVLVVDGDPDTDQSHAENYFLVKALAPPGEELTGYRVESISDSQFEDDLDLEGYQLIFLCNVYSLSDTQYDALKKWVSEGGGLVFALGDKINDEFYNDKLYDEGRGLFPLKLLGRRGDETEETWVNFTVEAGDHPALRIFSGPQNLFAEMVKVFQWWGGEVSREEISSGQITLAASFNDDDHSPAFVEKSVGSGRVLALMTPLDKDWSNWPGEFSFVPAIQELARYMARSRKDEGNLTVGQPIEFPLDPAEYKTEVRVGFAGTGDDDKRRTTTDQSILDEATNKLRFHYDETGQVGYFQVDLSRFDGQSESLLFATNLDPDEGDLRRIGPEQLAKEFGDSKIRFAQGRPSTDAGIEGAKKEFWFPILIGLIGVLGTEQFLAWLFGRRR